MEIPYGRSNFEEIRRKGYFYVDKTPFLPLLESSLTGYPVFLRPRRFGKSTLLSMLESYYDIAKREQFDELFKGLWVHEHPTPERNSYLVLTLDFSSVSTGADQGLLERSFLNSVKERLYPWISSRRHVVPDLDWLTDRIDGYQSTEDLMGVVLAAVQRAGLRLYLLIDEYDHFANRLLAGGGEALYDDAVAKRTGFIRTFYTKLKAGTQTGALARMFVTGVTPLMLDDLSSGFNISTNISMSARFNALAGFTRAEVERAVDALLAVRPQLAGLPELGDRDHLLDTLVTNYNGYRFSPDATERIFNSDLVLYFLRELAERGRYPENMLDPNVRTDYAYLQRIGTLTGTQADERRALLMSILGERQVRSELIQQFGVKSLSFRAPFVSLLYYLGMLTLSQAPGVAGGYDLEIPNRVIRHLQWEHLAQMLNEQARIVVDVEALRAALTTMTAQGDIEPFLFVFQSQVLQAFGVKDTRGLDEKTIKLLLMTYASLGRVFYPLSEKEFAQGYCDLFLGASPGVVSARFSWLLELKYLKANAKPAEIEAAFAAAEEQVERYASDAALLPLLAGDREIKAGMIVFVGTKRVEFRPWPAPREQRAPLPEGRPRKKSASAKVPAKGKSSTRSPKKSAASKRTTGRARKKV